MVGDQDLARMLTRKRNECNHFLTVLMNVTCRFNPSHEIASTPLHVARLVSGLVPQDACNKWFCIVPGKDDVITRLKQATMHEPQ